MGYKVFMMATSTGLVARVFEKKFKYFDETFVVHLFSEEYRVSHKETGFGVPLSDSHTIDGAISAAKTVLDYHGKESFIKTLNKSRNIRKDLKEN